MVKFIELINTCSRCGLVAMIFTAGVAITQYYYGWMWPAIDQIYNWIQLLKPSDDDEG